VLYHYTCHHGRRGIGFSGFIVPTPSLWGLPLVWLTDMRPPGREALGLTSHMLDCDRLAYCYKVDAPLGVEPWLESRARADAPLLSVLMLEQAPGVDPRRWFVSTARQFGALDRHYGLQFRRDWGANAGATP